ncbi:MAG TPA: NADH-quinone oxidoreductase subunit H, partial [Lacipirellulaceae bacterium]|nr:NADH-quinone oxidoreductase subunit H [Lacipirellulaceae bacterium]
GPLPVASWLGLTFEHGFWFGFAGNVLGAINVITKGVIGVTVMMWVRWTLPRLRIDQVITTCLKYCVPIAAVMFVLATAWQYTWPNRSFFGAVEAPAAAYDVIELRPHTEAKPKGPAASSPKSGGDRTAFMEKAGTR